MSTFISPKVASNWPRRYLAWYRICPTTGPMTVPSFKPLKPMQIDFQPKYGMSGLFERCGWWCHSFTPSSFTRLHVGANGETNGGTEPTQCRVQGTWWKCDFNIHTYYLHLCKQVSQLKVFFDISVSFKPCDSEGVGNFLLTASNWMLVETILGNSKIVKCLMIWIRTKPATFSFREILFYELWQHATTDCFLSLLQVQVKASSPISLKFLQPYHECFLRNSLETPAFHSWNLTSHVFQSDESIPGLWTTWQLSSYATDMKPSCSAAQRGTPEAFSYAFWLIFLQKHQLGFIFILDYTTEVEQFTPEFGKELFSGYVKPRGVVDQVAMLLRTISHSTLPDKGWHELFVAGTHDWIETVNGDTLPAIFRKRVFDPAGMSPKDTYCDLTHLVCRPMFLLDRNMFWETYDFSKPPFKKNPLTRRILGREAFGSSTFGHLLLGKIADHW